MEQQTFYQLAILGNAPASAVQEIETELSSRLNELGFTLHQEVSLFVGSPAEFQALGDRCTAVLCFPIGDEFEMTIASLMNRGIPVIPVASYKENLPSEFPPLVSRLNGMAWETDKATSITHALLECASLLPRNRRVFLSYRRSDSTEAALQLYAALSARLYDVFLDTHDIRPGQHFQQVLWQRLCDSDVLLFLDTPNYFSSRWTDMEFTRAEWRGIPLLRAAWPGVIANPRVGLATTIGLSESDFVGNGHLNDEVVLNICNGVEDLRARSVAERYQRLLSTLKDSVAKGRGKIEGVSLRRSLIVATPNGTRIAVYPALGVPTSHTLHNATLDNHPSPVAVVYEEAGIDEQEWKAHMDWITHYVRGAVRLVSSHRCGWDFADWS